MLKARRLRSAPRRAWLAVAEDSLFQVREQRAAKQGSQNISRFTFESLPPFPALTTSRTGAILPVPLEGSCPQPPPSPPPRFRLNAAIPSLPAAETKGVYNPSCTPPVGPGPYWESAASPGWTKGRKSQVFLAAGKSAEASHNPGKLKRARGRGGEQSLKPAFQKGYF